MVSLIPTQKSHINYLSKEELTYELAYRGILANPSSAVETLRKKLRENYQAETNSGNLNNKYKVTDELSKLEIRFAQLDSLFKDHNKDSALEYSKIKAKLAHTNIRLLNLGQAKSLSPDQEVLLNKYTSTLSELNDRAIKLCSLSEEAILNFNEVLNKSMEEEEETMEVLTQVKFSETDLNAASQLKATPELDKTILNTQHSEYTENQTSTPEVVNPMLNLAKNSQTINQTMQAISNHSLFSKLSNPVEKLLNQIKPCDGLETIGLLEFLRSLVQLRSQTSLSSTELFELLPVYTIAPLQSKIISCKLRKLSWDATHQEIISAFIPSSLYESLKHDLVLRPQHHQEHLSLYISEIKINSQVLRCNYSEEQLVQFIKDGIAPEVRNRLAFENNPTSFKDLETMAVSANNKCYLDYLRDQRYFNQPRPMFNNSLSSRNNCTYPASSSQNNPNRPKHFNTHQNFPSNQGNRVNKTVCYKCGKLGHIAKRCYSNNPRGNLN